MWILFFLSGIAGGILGGMGMGGGTLLIPILTVFLAVPQKTAQCINLLSFIPMSVIALYLHVKNGLVEKHNLLYTLLPALFLAVGASFLAVFSPPELLRKLFGGFLIALALFGIVTGFLQEKVGGR